MWTAILDYSQLANIYKISLSQKTPHGLAKNSTKARPQYLASALTVSNMLLLGFTQTKKREPSHLRRHIYKDNGLKMHSDSVRRVFNKGSKDY